MIRCRTGVLLLFALSACGPGEGGGAVECVAHSDCQGFAADVASLSAPVDAVRTLGDSRCQASLNGPQCTQCVCEIRVEDGGSARTYPLSLGLRTDCDAWSRSGECLLPASDFAGCTVGEEGSCAAACEEALGRVEADDRRTFSVDLRTAQCASDGFCDYVVQVDDFCYASLPGPAKPTFDCALSDEEILARATAVAAPSCSGGVCDGGVSISTPPPDCSL